MHRNIPDDSANFETKRHSPGVTFDGGKMRLNLPYHDCVEACWTYREPGAETVKIGQRIVVLHGHNLEPLSGAQEELSLKSVKTRSELAPDRAQEANSSVTETAFLPLPSTPTTNLPKRGMGKGQL